MVQETLDKIDYKILQLLLTDGRMSFSNISKEIKLTDVAVRKRIERLFKKKIIKSISAKINFSALGYNFTTLLLIKTSPEKTKSVIQKLNSLENISQVSLLLGDYNLSVKAHFMDMDEIKTFLNKLSSIDGIIEYKSCVVLEEIKDFISLPSKLLQRRLW